MDVALVSNASTAPANTPPPRPPTFLLPLPPRATQSRPRPGTGHPPDSFRWLGLPEELKLLVVRNVDHRIPTFDWPEPPTSAILALSSTSRWFYHVCKPLVWMVVKFQAGHALEPHRNLQAFEAILKHHEQQKSPLPVKTLVIGGLDHKDVDPTLQPMPFVEYAAEGAALARVVDKLASKSLEVLSVTAVKLEWAQGETLLRASRTAPRLSVLRLKHVEVWQDPQYLSPASNVPPRRSNAAARAAAVDASIASSVSSMVLSTGRVTRSMHRPLVLWTLSEQNQQHRPPLIKTLQIVNSHDMFVRRLFHSLASALNRHSLTSTRAARPQFTLANEAADLHSLAYWPTARQTDYRISTVLRELPHLRTLSLGGKLGGAALRVFAGKIQVRALSPPSGSSYATTSAY